MKLLLDTCVLCELAKPTIDQKVEDFIAQLESDSLFLSVVSLGEINKGIHLLVNGKRKTQLQHWMKTVQTTYSDRILGVDLDVATVWGEITALAQKKGKTIPVADGLIAATAISQGCHVVTRNIADFKQSPVLLIDPWEV